MYLLAVLALMGAGCATPTEVIVDDTTSDTPTEEVMEEHMDTTKEGETKTEEAITEETTEETDATEEEATADSEEVNVEVGIDGEVSVVTDETVEVSEDNGVEVTDIVLGGAPDVTIVMETGNFFFNPSTIKASPGDRVLIDFATNSGHHDFVIDELNVDYDIVEGETYIFTVPDSPGSYSYYCSIGSHRAMGMEGTLIIE